MKIFAQKACSAVHQTAIGQKNQKVDKQLHRLFSVGRFDYNRA